MKTIHHQKLAHITTRALSKTPSSSLPLIVSEEVQQALAQNKPVVSLESTILTHGFPYPENLSLGEQFEKAVRQEGGVPATIAFLKGVPHVGLSSSQLIELTENSKTAVKVSRRDIGHVMAKKLYGATTIASTSILSCMAGISVFGTGGLGGVHKEGQFTMDVSNDLVELGRNPITVVCAGPKSILDIGLTMEYLETQGVYVTTYNEFKDPIDTVEIPGFYARKSGIKSPNAFESFGEIADIIRHQRLMNLESGNLVCIPPPSDFAMDSGVIGKIIEDAYEEAKHLGIKGKEITPFLLLKIGEMTKGKSLDSNKHFVLNNIKCATKIASELTNLKDDYIDMTIVEEDLTDHALKHIEAFKPKPTSLVKSRKIGSLNHPVDLITPTVNEMNAIYESIDQNGRFNDDWFEVIDTLKLDDIQRFILKGKLLELYNEGIIQKCFRILPFARNILLKLGKHGVLTLGQTKESIFMAARKSQIQTANFYIDYYPVPPENENLEIVNMTGAGDSMLGYLISHYRTLDKEKLMRNCQLASGLSISHAEAINPHLKNIQ
ncbi:hypothetical protein PSN45_001851 [Yamadazyma tenuis]|uniref:uncharacterized protein n=1 Tax=Candida tenuis TaxID=2315449 RepID=UPI0027993B25|nr:hypothetical protein PSN45_001851 [Yamadazyma tenuis]